MTKFSRRKMLAGALPALGIGAAAKLAGLDVAGAATAPPASEHLHHHGAVPAPAVHDHGAAPLHPGFQAGGEVDALQNGFDPRAVLREFDWGQTRRLASGRVLREWKLDAQDKEIEVAPGVRFPAWTYNGRVPGPTLRCREGERLRIHFGNGSAHPHTVHFHGIPPAAMDGVAGIGAGEIAPG